MKHWTPPFSESEVGGDHSILPPKPMHREANDLGSRLARVEEHLQFVHWDRNRIERESRQRAKDLGLAVSALHETVRTEMKPFKDHITRLEHRSEMMKIWGGWAIFFGKFILASLIVIGVLTKHITLDQANMFGKWLGLPGG